ncbi:MAG: MFS transporter [Nocardioidaceae bacterium]
MTSVAGGTHGPTVVPDTGSAPGSVFHPRLRRATVGLVALIVLVAFEAMAVATAMPVAARELHGLRLYAWAFTAFMTASLFATAVSGPLCDRLGPRLPLVAGVVVFAAGLGLSGTAPTMLVFIVGRAVQGLGGGALIVAVYVVVGQVYPVTLRPRMFAWISAAWVVPSVVGPLVAGALAEHASWRWVFWGLVPFVALPYLLVHPAVPASRVPDPEAPRLAGRRTTWAVLLAVGVVALQQGGTLGEDGHVVPGVLLSAAGVALMLPALHRLLPPGTLRVRRGLPSVIALRGVMAGAFFATESFLPLMLVTHRGLTPTGSGLSLTGAAFGWAFGSWWQGRLAGLEARGRIVRIGAGIVLVGIMVGVSPVWDRAPWSVPSWFTALGWTTAGIGMGMVFSSLSVLLLDLSSPDEQGVNSAGLQMADALGSIVLAGLGGVVYASLRGATDQVTLFAAVFAAPVLVALAALAVAWRVLPPRPVSAH